MSSLTNPNDDPNVGSSRGDSSSASGDIASGLTGSGSSSSSALLMTFLPALIYALFWVGLFLIFRRTQRRWYAPRSHLPNLHDHQRSPELPSGWVNWVGEFLKIEDNHVLHHSSLDGYLFLRFLRVLCALCFTGCVLTWPILFPIHATGGNGNTQLDILSFSNIANPSKYYANVFVACVYFTFVFYVVVRESLYYANLRQVYLNSPAYASRVSSRTVLFMSVPPDYRNEKKLRSVFGDAIQQIWITSNCKELADLVDERDKYAYRLEAAETKLIRRANKARLQAIKKGELSSMTCLDCESSNPAWSQEVKRPNHRLHVIFGKKVDTIHYYREELARVTEEVNALQRKHQEGDAKQLSAIFIEFNTQNDAQIAFQTLSHHQPFHMTPRFIGVSPQEVVWSALNISWKQRVVRRFAVQGFLAVMVIFWSFPAAIVGTISNITYLCQIIPFLGFILKLPNFVKGAIEGLLPSASLALLMSLVPIICRICARRSGVPSLSRVELFTQSAVFVFQVVQVFLVTTLTSAASAATAQIIKNPLSIKDLLAQNLPKATNFYISYFLLQGLSMSSMALVQIASALIFRIINKFFARSPRRLYNKWAQLASLSWGSVFPVFTNMGVIALTYSCIAPLILGFSFIGLYMVYQAYRYNFFFVYDIEIDTKGLVYPRALQHLLTGLYIAEICMIGLCAIKGAVGPVIIMAIFLVVNILAHISLNEALTPLNSFLPRSLDAEEELLQEKEDIRNEINEQCRSRSLAFWRWFHPNIYKDYAALRRKVRKNLEEVSYSPEELRTAYFEPCIASPSPTLWIPRDKFGFSRHEVMETDSIISITDEGAHLDEKNRIIWDKYDPTLPLRERKILY
ncbi:phosphate metabolism [Penicillium sp. IBT 16267x]|nr:phosphate metabolism [Penicillium sp. IBT 16267x]